MAGDKFVFFKNSVSLQQSPIIAISRELTQTYSDDPKAAGLSENLQEMNRAKEENQKKKRDEECRRMNDISWPDYGDLAAFLTAMVVIAFLVGRSIKDFQRLKGPLTFSAGNDSNKTRKRSTLAPLVSAKKDNISVGHPAPT